MTRDSWVANDRAILLPPPVPPQIFVSVASKGFRSSVSALESTFAGTLVVIDSKGLTLRRFGHDFDRWRSGMWP